ncbi:MAG TPA: hypothetical protein VFI25_16905 [Planctomycetota bacterium]|nr:hypothetical protein [Planctomycetota bacterium]
MEIDPSLKVGEAWFDDGRESQEPLYLWIRPDASGGITAVVGRTLFLSDGWFARFRFEPREGRGFLLRVGAEHQSDAVTPHPASLEGLAGVIYLRSGEIGPGRTMALAFDLEGTWWTSGGVDGSFRLAPVQPRSVHLRGGFETRI